jgi:glycosyltransferase involved in cell wall biosynthesis
MTILVVHNRYRVRGGEDGVFETECRLLEEAGHKVVRYEKDNRDIPDRGGRLGLALRTIWNPRTYCEIRAIIRAERPDVVHCHNTFPLISPSIYWAAARAGVPVVQTLHNYRLACLNGYLFRDGHVCEDCLGRAPWRGVCRRCYRDSRAQSAVAAATLLVHRLLGTYRRKVARYIALTGFARDKFIAMCLPAGKISVKPNAFAVDGGKRAGLPATVASSDPQSDNPETRNPETPAPPLRVVYLGRLSPEKGVDVLLRAWALICREADGRASCEAAAPPPRPSLEVIGSGPEEGPLRSLADSLGISSSVSFLGALPRDEALAVLSSASLLVLPSLCYETFGLTILEAASQGVPAVATNIGGQSALVQDGVTGRLVPPSDPAALAASLHDLFADPAALRRMGDAARAAFEASDCRPDRNLARLLEIYESVRT